MSKPARQCPALHIILAISVNYYCPFIHTSASPKLYLSLDRPITGLSPPKIDIALPLLSKSFPLNLLHATARIQICCSTISLSENQGYFTYITSTTSDIHSFPVFTIWRKHWDIANSQSAHTLSQACQPTQSCIVYFTPDCSHKYCTTITNTLTKQQLYNIHTNPVTHNSPMLL